MKDESRAWIVYAQENLTSARILYSSHLLDGLKIAEKVLKSIKKVLDLED
jgi:hypothetical protein